MFIWHARRGGRAFWAPAPSGESGIERYTRVRGRHGSVRYGRCDEGGVAGPAGGVDDLRAARWRGPTHTDVGLWRELPRPGDEPGRRRRARDVDASGTHLRPSRSCPAALRQLSSRSIILGWCSGTEQMPEPRESLGAKRSVRTRGTLTSRPVSRVREAHSPVAIDRLREKQRCKPRSRSRRNR